MPSEVKIKTSGLEELVKEFETLSNQRECDETFEEVVEAGANVVADYMRKQLEGLKTQSKANKRTDKRYATENEKKGLLESMGYAPVKKYGDEINSKIGFDGYNRHTRSQKANQLIANSINRGTSFMIAQPFVTRTKNAGQAKAIDAMSDALDAEIKKRTH